MTKENTLYLISLVKSYACLWNEKDPDFENELTKADAWQRISETMGRSVEELKSKWDSMHNCFVTCHAKNLSNIIKNKWFAYNALRFLESKIPHDEPKEPEQTIEEESSDTNDTTVKGGMSNDRSLCLINLVKGNKCLWDKDYPEYKNRAIKLEAWKEISQTMGLPVDKVKMQWDALRTINRQHIGRLQKKWKNGSSTRKPKWFAFDAMRFINVTRDFLPQWEKGLNEWPYSDETDDEDPPKPELVNVGNIGNNSVAVKSEDIPTVKKLTKVTPQIHVKPQNLQSQIPNGIPQNPQKRILAPVRVKRLVPSSSAQDPLRIVRKVPPQLGQTAPPAVTNQSSVKSFVNLLEQELNALSADYATMAQVEIYRIIGEFKLKDVTRRNTVQTVKMTSQPKKIIRLNHHKPMVAKTDRTNVLGNNSDLEVLMECEEA